MSYHKLNGQICATCDFCGDMAVKERKVAASEGCVGIPVHICLECAKAAVELLGGEKR